MSVGVLLTKGKSSIKEDNLHMSSMNVIEHKQDIGH